MSSPDPRSGTRKRPDSWRAKLLEPLPKDSPHKLRPIVANAVTVLTHDERWTGVLAYDEFAEGIVTLKVPPWRKQDAGADTVPGDWSNDDTIRVQCWLSEHYALDIGQDAVLSAVCIASHRKRVHPLRDWLDSLRWKAKKQLPTWLVDVMGCPDTPYVRAVGQAWAVSAVARAYKPGCKVDTVLVLEGITGGRKSSVLRALAGDTWFLEMSITDVANKDAMQILRRKWLAEFPEIDGLSRTEQAHVKSYFSRQVDTYRNSYGRGSRDFPRQTVFAATTNKSEYLTDETGGTGRRMWPVRCGTGDVERAKAMRDQFWAEAVVRYQSGEEWHMRDPELISAEREEQEARYRQDPWEDRIAAWLARPSEVGPPKSVSGVTTSDVLTGLGLETARLEHSHAMRAGACLRRLSWHTNGLKELRNGSRVRVYRPIDAAHANGVAEGVATLPAPPPDDIDESTEDLFPPQVRQ